MMREHLDKYHSNAEWRAAYDAALAKAEANGSVDADAIAFATTSADIAIAEASDEKTKQDASLEATRQRLAAREAAERETPAASEPKLDGAEAARKAVAAINAGRGYTDEPAQDQEAKASVEGQTESEEEPKPASEAVPAGFAKAVERINAGR